MYCWNNAQLSLSFLVPTDLMRPKAPKIGKKILLERITPLWRRLSFNYKVTLRNIFRYKQRMIMTVLGIAGCMALLVTGFGLKDSNSGMVNKEYLIQILVMKRLKVMRIH